MSAPTTRFHWVAVVAAGLVAIQLGIRAVVAFEGYFYWDDLILVGRAGTQPILSADYLFADHDGHVMPGAFLIAGVITRLAPLDWLWPAVSLVILQLVASLALLRALHVILGWRPALLIPLTFALFTPLGLPAFSWWAAGLNALPMLAAMTWFCADAIQLVRTGRRRYLATAVVALVGGLVFFEKAAVIPFVGFVIAAVLTHVTASDAVSIVWRQAKTLWIASLGVIAAWVALYLVVVDQRRWSTDLSMTGELLLRSFTHGIVPGLVGGPWSWQRWAPASPWAVPPTTVMVLGWAALAAVVALSFRLKRRIGWVWAVAFAYAVACQVPIYLMRSSAFTALELAQTLRYLADLVVVLALYMAIAITAPDRQPVTTASLPRVVAVVATAAVTASSVYSTLTYLTVWRDNPAEQYLRNAERSLAEAHRGSSAPLLDQEVDPLVLQRVAYPENLASHMFALLKDRPDFAAYTTDLRMLDNSGRLFPALVTWTRSIAPGPEPGCGYLIQPGRSVTMRLDGPLLPADWTAEINYLANSDGSLTMSLDDGTATRFPVRPGLNRVFVRLAGAGDAVTVEANTAALSVCIAAGPVGFLAIAPR
ncbi:hypothetical protein LV457_10870 [Mycobacterium sp. MYCO198283]|uniref:hypothetical protein n=1 Tax=Mycobacterium sp. MYCO198283 TaxID=2883505 RepID=UPI001E59CD19|nr:hypothetical protein [Mycobacterium sp. MYCO198283]MCG5432787.1 hypothetical protein [Mycobacterium sp. MYCO198283]